MSERRPLVGLLTDFGTRDHYVAAMKGVILSRVDADLVDLSHEITAFEPFEAGWFLRSMRETFDASRLGRVVIVAVVDPGVGTSRRIVAAVDESIFWVAPDNGLLPLALSPRASFVAVENEALFLPGGSTTFHGRDRFAPVAAALAHGSIGLDDLGPSLPRSELVSFGYAPPERTGDEICGTVIAVDRFGNIVTDIDASMAELENAPVVQIGTHTIREIRQTYGQEPSPEPFLLVGSRGTVEISLMRESAAARLQCAPLDEVRLSWSPASGDDPKTED